MSFRWHDRCRLTGSPTRFTSPRSMAAAMSRRCLPAARCLPGRRCSTKRNCRAAPTLARCGCARSPRETGRARISRSKPATITIPRFYLISIIGCSYPGNRELVSGIRIALADSGPLTSRSLIPEMLHELARIDGQFVTAFDANGEIADRPRIRQRNWFDRHRCGDTVRRGLGHDADAGGFAGQEALQRAGAIETDKIVFEHFLEADPGALGERMPARDHQHKAVAAERIGLECTGIDRAGDDTEVGDPFRDQTD